MSQSYQNLFFRENSELNHLLVDCFYYGANLEALVNGTKIIGITIEMPLPLETKLKKNLLIYNGQSEVLQVFDA